MQKLLCVYCCLFFVLSSPAQVGDFISVKRKNGITVQNFLKDNPIEFISTDGFSYSGNIDDIRNDSLFLRVFQIYRQYTIWGTWIPDTISSAVLPFHYKDIQSITITKTFKRRSALGRLGIYMKIGGAGYTVLNIVNGLTNDPPLMKGNNLTRLGIAAAVAGTGHFLQRRYAPDFSRRNNNYRIKYVNLQ